MKRSRKLKVAGLVACVFLLGAIVLAVPELRWRSVVVALKVTGQLELVGWRDLGVLLHPDTGISLRRLAGRRNPYRSVLNPFDSPDDVEQGEELFARRCSMCHGTNGVGASGPALRGRSLKSGDSDWARFKTISQGVPGTVMLPIDMPADEVWRVIAYLTSLSESDADAASTQADSAIPDTQFVEVTDSMLRQAADDSGWLLPSGTYDGQRFSHSSQVNSENVGQLAAHWIRQFGTSDERIETIPIVVDNVMYVTLPGNSVLALDATSGKQIWQYDYLVPDDVRLCCLKSNRGVAVSGNRVFMGTLDAHLVALDAATGRQLWETETADHTKAYSITAAPIPVEDMVIAGMGGGDFPTRGFISAYDAETGELRWRFHTVPAPGEPENDTWAGDSWRTGGAATWNTGSYDKDSGILYWGTGNPAPTYDARRRAGDNLYSNSIVALNARTGELIWHFQFTPGDDHDWDSVQTPILIDLEGPDGTEELVAVANRNAFFYVLDRNDGSFIRANSFVKQTWNLGFEPDGRPIKAPDISPTPTGRYLNPSITGGTNFWPASYSPVAQHYYVVAIERGGVFFREGEPPEPVEGRSFSGSGGRHLEGDSCFTYVKAIDPKTAEISWEYRNKTCIDYPRGGVLATAGGLVFGSDDERIYALDAASGEELWAFDTGGSVRASPISYTVDGRQIIAVVAGQLLITFALPDD